MAIQFSQFSFHNESGVDVIVTLEGPPGPDGTPTVIISEQNVTKDTDYNSQLASDNIQTITLLMYGDPANHPDPATQKIDVSGAGSPNPAYITTVTVRYMTIGLFSVQATIESDYPPQ